jgi:hypothetical protein
MRVGTWQFGSRSTAPVEFGSRRARGSLAEWGKTISWQGWRGRKKCTGITSSASIMRMGDGQHQPNALPFSFFGQIQRQRGSRICRVRPLRA